MTDTNGMTGTLAVTVIGTMPTGNLLVAGEKLIAMNGNHDRLRLSGIVNPKDIEAGNFVSSSKVANAKIEQAGSGIAERYDDGGVAAADVPERADVLNVLNATLRGALRSIAGGAASIFLYQRSPRPLRVRDGVAPARCPTSPSGTNI